MLILRIKRAEVALADGRLDEAYQQAIRDDVRQHRRGQKLVDRLVKRLMEQGQLHAAQDQPEQALFDYERAARIGGNQPRLMKLRQEATEVMNLRSQEKRRRNQLVNAARRQIEQGDLSVGARLVNNLDVPGDAADRLADDIAVKRVATEASLKRAEGAIGREDYGDAISALKELRRIQPGNQRLAELTGHVTKALVEQAKDAIDGGRLDKASLLLNQASMLPSGNIEVPELTRVVRQCQAASSYLRRGDIQQGLEKLTRIAQLLPDADWLHQAVLRAEQASTALSAIETGPLGLLDSKGASAVMNGNSVEKPVMAEIVTGPRDKLAAPTADVLATRFLLQVDGGGSFVVGRGSVTTIGPASSSRRPDIGLLAPSNAATVRIERLEGDYFLRGATAVRVNDKKVTQKLLSHGDRITLGPRCSFRFLVPNAASTSAVLDLSGARFPRRDIRRVVLLDESIVLGPSRTAHIQVSDQPKNIVLHLRNDQLHYRNNAGMRVHGTEDQSIPIPTGKPIEIGEISIVLTELNSSEVA